MKQILTAFLLAGLAIAALATPLPASEPAALEAGFANPPASALPRTWWHWVSGYVTKEGITADLEAMKRVGLGGAQMFSVDMINAKGSATFMSPEWRELVKHSLNEAERLGLEISMHSCDGWSISGGSWVQPEGSMQKVVWSEALVEGGKTVPLSLPQPETQLGHYRDIALMAYKAAPGDVMPAPLKVTTNPPSDATAVPTAASPLKLAVDPSAPAPWIDYEFQQPFTCGSFSCERQGDRQLPTFGAELQSSDDGKTYRTHVKISEKETMGAFQPATARFFRVVFHQSAPQGGWRPELVSANILAVSKFTLAGVRLTSAVALAGMESKKNLPFATPESALPATGAKDIIDLTGKTQWDAPEGIWTLLRIGHTGTGARSKRAGTGGLECDKMSAEAVNSHIDQLFKTVWEDSPGKAGGTFRYILMDSWEAGCANWTPRMPEEFRKRRGYDLQPWLPALTGHIIGNEEETERFLWDYRLTIAELVAENHYGVFQKRAHEKGMGLMSEAAGINMPTIADQLLCKKYCDVPMGEFWMGSDGERFYEDLKEATSAAHLFGQNIASSESFTAGPGLAWRVDPYALKSQGDKVFCNGINLLIFHRYAHQPWLDRKPGMSMGPFGMNFERTNTWWNQGSAWLDYLSRCSFLLQQGRFVADLCYFYGEGAPVCLKNAELSPAVPKGYDFDVCNADVLLNLMEVKNGRITTPSGMSYRVLVLPTGDRMTLPVLQKIARLVRDGAVVYGPKPLRSPSLAGYPAVDQEITKLADEVWGNCDGKSVTEHAYGAGKIVWGQPIEQVLAVPPDFSSPKGNLLYIHRQEGDTDIYFVSNQDTKAITAECAFRVEGKVPELWHPDTGQRETLALYTTKNGVTTLPLALDPSGSVFVVFRKSEKPAPHWTSLQVNGANPFAGAADFGVGIPVFSKNGITFTANKQGTFDATMADGAVVQGAIPAPPAPIAINGPWQVEFPPISNKGEILRTTFEKLGSWSDSTEEWIKYYSGTATYRTSFQVLGLKSQTSKFLLDLGGVKNIAEVSLNGKPLGILWKEPFRVDVTEALVEGKNELTIQITNLWPNRLIGDQKLPEKERSTWTSHEFFKATDRLLPSGLLGPVQILPVEVVKVP